MGGYSLRSVLTRAATIAVPVSVLQVGIHGGELDLATLSEVTRAAVTMTSAVAVVLVVLQLMWPSVRSWVGLRGRTDQAGQVLATGLGVSVAMMVLSWLHGVIESTSSTAAHTGLAGGAMHHEMGALEHAVRDGGAVAPLVIAVLALTVLARQAGPALARARARGLRSLSVATSRWAVLSGFAAGLLVAVPATQVSAAPVPAPACSAGNAVRVYDVAATNVFIPYTRWMNDSGVPQNGPDGEPHLTDGDPGGMLFVLQQDQAAVENWSVPLVGNAANGYAGDPADGRRLRPRPLVLRANAGECIQVTLTNELNPAAMAPFLPQVDPRVSMHAFGVAYAPNTGDGSSVGYNTDTTIGVGETITYFWRAPSTEGLYLFRDMGMPAGANADGGGAEHGLYGGLAVQPAGSRWFDPVSGVELSSPIPDQQYATVAGQSGELYIDAAIVLSNGKRFRETIQISQDVIPVVPAVAAPGAPPNEAPERFSFNFGSEAEYKRVQFKPTWCADCVGEETGLSSWVFGDPATVKLAAGSGPWLPVQPDFGGIDPLSVPAGVPAVNVEDCGLLLTNAPTETRPVSCYTANVARAYQGDPIKIRFGHAGVFETHVFHLHAHTWGAEPQDGGPAGSTPPRPTAASQNRSQTVDSQTYSPWTAFTADLNYGAGARIGTVGDSIFHCHLYPHFAAGFWSLLRVHDAYESGDGALPDGTRVNRWVALEDFAAPGLALHPEVPLAKNVPSIDFPGYPRFIPGEFGWRAPQPVNGVWQREFDVNGDVVLDGQGNPVDAPAMRIVAGRALDPALLEQTQNIVTTATDGSFTLSFGGQTTAPITLPTTDLTIQNALQALPNIEAVLVEGTGTALDPFAVQLVLWTSTADLTITATYTPVAPFVAPTITTALSQSIVADAGVEAFTLSVAGLTTTPIDLVDPLLPAADVQIATALDALAGIDTVTVTGTGTTVDPWVVTFTAAPATDPTITTAVTLPVAPTTLVVTATVEQTVVAEPGVQAFTLGIAGETTTPIVLADPTPAAQIATALDALVAVADLSTTVTGTGTALDPWVITFTTAPTGNPTLTTTVTAPVAPGVVVTPEVGFLPADPVTARIMFRLAQEEHTTRKFHDPTYVAGGPVDPANQPLPGAPVVDPCPAGARVVTYRASVIQLPITYNEAGWIDFQGRIMVADEDVDAILAGTKEPEPFFFRANQGDCINFEMTNRTPNHIGNDAYQQLVQTNMVGGHIHLVNFDVLSSDGSSNGWNYQQAAFTEDQATFNDAVIEGLQPCNVAAGCRVPLPAVYDPVAESADARGNWLKNGQTIKERWFADYELRTVFMHDHHFAAVMQNRGMFNALIIEPAGFDSRDPETGQWLQPINNPTRGPICGASCVGTAHGAKMDMVGPGVGDDFREFGLAIHDFIPLFIPVANGVPLTLADIQNPANAIAPPPAPSPAAENDQGGMAVNYKNEPMKLRQFPGGVDPLVAVVGQQVDPAYTFSSRVWGDPVTPVLNAYRGDNVRYRLIQGSHEEQHNFTVHGTRWHKDPSDPASPFVNTRPIGVSEAFNVDDVAVGCGLGQTGTCFDFQPGQPRVSDFMYGGTGIEDLWFGAWGIMRVFDQTTDSGVGAAATLLPLPDNNVTLPAGVPLPAGGVENLTIPPGGTTADGVLPRAQLNVSCPNGSTFKSFNVSVIDVPITYNRYGDHDPYGLAYVLTSDAAAIRAGTRELEPLVLRANEGDCIVVNLRNEVDWDAFAVHGDLGTLDGDAPMPLEPLPIVPPEPGEPPAPVVPGLPWIAGNRVSMHPSLLRYDVRTSDGTTVGYSLDQTAGPGQTVSYLWYADEIVYDDPLNPTELTDGELGVVPLMEFGDVRGHRHHGMLAALVVGPANATYHDQVTGARVNTGVAVDVRVPGAADDYRDVVLFQHNGLNIRGPAGPGGVAAPVDDPIPADWPDLGERAISYSNAPFHHRLGLANPLVNPLADPRGLPFSRPNFGDDLANVFSSTHQINGQPIGDPDTPIVRAYQGDPLRIHVVQSSDRGRMIQTEVSGHSWLEQPFDAGSIRAGVQGSMATGSAFTFHIDAAGGDMQNVGDYRYGVIQGISGISSGTWGIVRVYPKPPVGRERLLSPIAAAANPYDGGNPIQVLNQDLLPAAPAVQVDVQAPLDFGLLQIPATSLTVTATVTTQAGAIMPSQVVDFTWPGGTATATTNAFGVATIQVPVVLPVGMRTVTATVNPAGADAATDSVVLEFINPNLDLVAPTVTGVTPTNAATAISPNASAVVAFSERMHPSTIDATSVSLLDGATVVPAAVTLSPDRLTATVVPTAPLSIGTTYTVRVTTAATDLVGRPLGAQFQSTFTTWGVPAAPTSVTGMPGNDLVTLSWTAPADGGTAITGYTVSVRDENGVVLPGLGGPTGSTSTTFVVTGLENGTIYTFTVAAVNGAGTGPASAPTAPVEPAAVPDAPENVAAAVVDPQPFGPATGVVDVTWTEPDNNGSNIDLYTVTAQPGGITCVSTTTTCQFTGLTNGFPYTFTVVATNAIGDSVASASAAATPRSVPFPPFTVTAVAGDAAATVSWTASLFNGGSPITGYQVTVLDAFGAPTGLTGCTVGAVLTCNITGLTNGTGYRFAVVATNAAGASDPSMPSAVVTPLPTPAAPGAPTGVATAPANGAINVSWVAPVNTGTSALTGFVVTASPGGASCTTGAAGTSCVVPGLTPGQQYTLSVVAQNAVGNSAPATIVATVATAPGTPVNVTAAQVPGTGSVLVEWDAPVSNGGAPITSYTVTTLFGGTCLSTTESCTLTGLQAGDHVVLVRAVNVAGTGSPAFVAVTITDFTPPAVPAGLVAAGDNGQVALNWSPSGGDTTGYVVSVDGTPLTVGMPVSGTSFVVTGLTNDTSYVFAVASVDAAGNQSAFSAPVTSTPRAVVRFEQTAPGVLFTSGWSTSPAPQRSGGSARVTSTPNTEMNVVFEGSTVRWIASTGPNRGQAVVSIDGGTPVVVDLYSPTLSYQQTVFQRTGLGDGSHTMSITTLATRNAASTGRFVEVDALEAVNIVALQRVEDGAPGVLYSTGWSTSTTADRSGGTARITASSGLSLDVVFTGTAVRWIGSVGPNRGEASVSIDGGAPVVVDLYAPALAYRQVVFQVAGLAPGEHTMRITTLPTRNENSTANFVEIDALDVTNVVPMQRLEQTAPGVIYSTGWTNSAAAERTGGNAQLTSLAGRTATVVFDGTSVRWIGSVGPNRGRASVSIDGGAPVVIDTYSPTLAYQRVLFQQTGLTDGVHVMTITTLATTNPASSGTIVEVDAIDAETLVVLQRVQETSANAVFSSGWTVSPNVDRSGGSARLSATTNSTVTFTFTGSVLRWLGSVGSNRGIANVSIDGGPPVAVDLYSPTLSYQQTLFQRTDLGAGPHTVTITVTGTRNPLSTGNFVEVDAFDVLGL